MTDRTIPFGIPKGLEELSKKIIDSVNGTLQHELSVGDSAYIQTAAKIVVPFSPENQLIYSLGMGMSVANAVYLTVARWGLHSYWGNFLTAVDIEEAVIAEEVEGAFKVVKVEGNAQITVAANSKFNTTTADVTVTVPHNIVKMDFGELERYTIDNTVRADMVFLHMKDVGLLVAANLVKTGHHYQTLTNGSFKAMERKRFGKDLFSADVKGIIYHDSMHCFTQVAKLRIYMEALAQTKSGKAEGIFTLIDPVVKKRLPVVPAGAAWLSAGITVMNELLSIPKVAAKIPPDYATIVTAARKALTDAMMSARVDISSINQFEALAAFAFGVLVEIAPMHSAAKAPSLIKIADIHLGARTAGTELGRASLRGEL
jgi:hypothetical protein